MKKGAADLKQYLIVTDCHLCTLCTITRCWDSIHSLQIEKKGRRKCTASAMCDRSPSRLQPRVTVSQVNKLRVSSWSTSGFVLTLIFMLTYAEKCINIIVNKSVVTSLWYVLCAALIFVVFTSSFLLAARLNRMSYHEEKVCKVFLIPDWLRWRSSVSRENLCDLAF